tara:strand:- start:100 stop:801 length:702 start_codon:yes stop_codon:yes gene_type:complete
MKIIDSHIHFWDTGNGLNDWVKETNLPKKVIPNDIVDTDSFVHIEAHTPDQNSLCEYNWLKSNFPNKNIKVVAFVDFTQDLDIFKKDVALISRKEDIVGVRHIMAKTDKSKYSPFDDRVPYDLLEKLRVLKDNNLIFEAQLYPEQFLPLLKLINTSGVIMAIEHFGLPIFGDNSNLVEWHSLINQIAQNKKWYLKLSGFDLNNNFKYLKIALEVVFQNIQSNRLCYGCENDII